MSLGNYKESTPSTYAVLAEQLRRSIHEGDYRPGQLFGSEHELARRQGISRVTVRRASELLVDEGLLERRPGKGLYIRAPHAQTKLVHVITANLHWYPPRKMVQGIQEIATGMNIQLGLYDACSDMENMARDMALLRQLPSGRGGGAIVTALPGSSFNQVLCELAMKRFPLVLVAQRLHEIEASSVISDNHNGGYQAGQALLELGHRRIGFIGDLASSSSVRDRLAGLRDAIADAVLPYDRSLEIDLQVEKDPIGDWSKCAAEGAHALTNRPTPPTAILCSCDGVAISACRVLRQKGLRVPEDVSVIGYGNDPLTESVVPALTSVSEPYEQMGRLAMEVLSRRMDDCYSAVEHHVLPVELVQRDSVAPPPADSRCDR
ncbi:MAG TPA: hypothetical protein DCX07_01200 [Phycisphaerales bacterium]|nr:hypothetical protein [Phycisphaerales bacterium]